MKLVIYKYPVISAIIINISAFYIATYLYKNTLQFIIMFLLLVGFSNRNIIDNGSGMNTLKKVIIIGSLMLMIIIFLFSVYNTLISTY